MRRGFCCSAFHSPTIYARAQNHDRSELHTAEGNCEDALENAYKAKFEGPSRHHATA
jgi:hypothetical protein